jgi:hypothetical protein
VRYLSINWLEFLILANNVTSKMETKEIINDFKESFLERIKNPFVLLYVFSWLGWNWLLVFEIFSFPYTYTLENRIKIINDYVQAHLWCNLTFWPVWSAFLGACVFIIFSSIFLLMFSWFQRTLKPKIYKLTAQDENIPRYLYEGMHRRHDRLKRDFDSAKKLYVEIEETKADLDSTITTLQTENTTLKSNLNKTEKLFDQTKIRISELEKISADANEVFSRTFMNDKFWYMYYDDAQKKDLSSHNQVRFNKDYTLTNTNNDIISQVKDIHLTDDNQIVQFKLANHRDLKNIKTYHLFNIEDGNFKGIEISQNGEKKFVSFASKPPEMKS